MKQSQEFMQGEGAAWLQRNIHKINADNDPVLEAMEQHKLNPKSVIEIGCANGWRLKTIQDKYNCHAEGVDPGAVAGFSTQVQVWASTATKLYYQSNNSFDLVIYGFCLYLCDPEDYFRIAVEGDRVLQDRGFLIVYDFCSERPYKVPYKHKKGLYSHHYDFSKLWLSHPAYSVYGRTVQDETCVTILRKNLKNAFPVER